MKKHYWTGFTKEERIKAIRDITNIVDRYAIILHFQKFSDVSLSLVLEVEECKLNDLQLGLNAILSLEGVDANFSNSTADCRVMMNITFAKGSGDLAIEVPDIPG